MNRAVAGFPHHHDKSVRRYMSCRTSKCGKLPFQGVCQIVSEEKGIRAELYIEALSGSLLVIEG